jgi:hypothetical protein
MTVSLIMLITGSLLAIGWGVAHLWATRPVIEGFGEITPDNRLIIRMEWITSGMTLVFLGFLVLIMSLLGGNTNPFSVLVCRMSALMLLALAGLALMTGGRTALIPLKMCPVVKTVAALLILLGTL